MRGEENQIVRRNWKMLGVEPVVFERPHKYFKEIILLDKKQQDGVLQVKAKVVVDRSGLYSLINQATASVIDNINDVGLTVLFLARSSDKEINYSENVIQDDIVLDDATDSEVIINKSKSIKRES